MGCDCSKQRDKPPETPILSSVEYTIPIQSTPQAEPGPTRSNIELNPHALEAIRKLNRPIESIYRIRKTIHETSHFSLHHAEYLGTKQQCYLKVIPKSQSSSQRQSLQQQVERLSKLDHPVALRLYEAFQDDNAYYLAMETYAGGTLMDNLGNPLIRNERNAAKILYQLLSYLAYIHSMGILHGDISPLSIVFSTAISADNVRVKVTGMEAMDTVSGEFIPSLSKSHFQCPDKKPSDKSEIWSLGIVLYTMIIGESPFTGMNEVTVSAAKGKEVVFTGREWEGKSPQLLSLLPYMLHLSAKSRPSAQSCRTHAWLQQYNPSLKASQLAPLLPQLQQYQPGNPLKEGIMKFILSRILSEKDFTQLIDTFLYIDSKDGNGQISIEELSAAYKRIMTDSSAEETAQTVMNTADLNLSGSLSYTEYLFAMLDEAKLLKTEHIRLAFNCMDSDHSGAVTTQELRAVFYVKRSPEAEQQWRELMEMADKSRDGMIDYDEFIVLMGKSVRKKRQIA